MKWRKQGLVLLSLTLVALIGGKASVDDRHTGVLKSKTASTKDQPLPPLVLRITAPEFIGDIARRSSVPTDTQRKSEEISDDAEYDEEWPFTQDGLAIVRTGDKFAYIDRERRLVTPPHFDKAYDFEDGRAMVKVGDKFGFIDEAGNYIASPQFDEAWTFSEGIAVVRVGGSYGHIDRSGRFVSAPSYSYAQWFREGLSAVEVQGRYGYIAPTGHFAIQPQFEKAGSFENGVALVEAQGRQWYIDHHGNYVKPGP